MTKYESLIERIDKIESVLNEKENKKQVNEAIPALAIAAAKIIAKNLPLILTTLGKLKEAMDDDADTEEVPERKSFSDKLGQFLELAKDLVEPIEEMGKM